MSTPISEMLKNIAETNNTFQADVITKFDNESKLINKFGLLTGEKMINLKYELKSDISELNREFRDFKHDMTKSNEIFQTNIMKKLDVILLIIKHKIDNNEYDFDNVIEDEDDIDEVVNIVPTKPVNSMYWFKSLWKTDRNETIKKYCNLDMMTNMFKHMRSDDNKDKVDDVKLDAEFKFIWTTYCSSKTVDNPLRDRIRKDYENFKVDFDKQKQTDNTKDEFGE